MPSSPEVRNARLRFRYANDPEYREMVKARRAKYAAKPEAKEKRNKTRRVYLKNNPEKKEQFNAASRIKRATDESYRVREIAYSKKYKEREKEALAAKRKQDWLDEQKRNQKLDSVKKYQRTVKGKIAKYISDKKSTRGIVVPKDLAELAVRVNMIKQEIKRAKSK